MSVPGVEPFEGTPGPASPPEKATGIVAFLGSVQGKALRPTAGLASRQGRARRHNNGVWPRTPGLANSRFTRNAVRRKLPFMPVLP